MLNNGYHMVEHKINISKVSIPQQLQLGSQEACFIPKQAYTLCTFLKQI